jgi:hypothetical protein
MSPKLNIKDYTQSFPSPRIAILDQRRALKLTSNKTWIVSLCSEVAVGRKPTNAYLSSGLFMPFGSFTVTRPRRA